MLLLLYYLKNDEVTLSLIPYIITNGNGQEAVKFYQEALDAQLANFQTYGDLPDNPEFKVPEEMKSLVLHAQLRIENSELMISDNLPNEPYEVGSHLNIAIVLDDKDKAKTIFDRLKEGGEVVLPLEATAWSEAYGQVKDKYGLIWQISVENSKND